jgi:hypothetical protein
MRRETQGSTLSALLTVQIGVPVLGAHFPNHRSLRYVPIQYVHVARLFIQ